MQLESVGRGAYLLEYRFRESCHKQGIHLSFQAPMCAGGIEDEGLKAMAAWRRAIELSLGDADVEGLRSIAQSRTEPRAGSSGRGFCWRIGKTRRFLR